MILSDEEYAQYRNSAIPLDEAQRLSNDFAEAAVEHFKTVLREHPREGIIEDANNELTSGEFFDHVVRNFSKAYMAYLSESGSLKI